PHQTASPGGFLLAKAPPSPSCIR
ncbi:transcriptional regulator, partial [Salmonella enterica subsp. enterica serovar Enteritidis]|nr:transcriptional regulator [Salmonella enterica]ECW4742274.1 transcriptional regulator [Salmonella enterica subsp. enterica serovar Enteritidis]MGD20984.1 transcriptional regulator [Salmonella enterica]